MLGFVMGGVLSCSAPFVMPVAYAEQEEASGEGAAMIRVVYKHVDESLLELCPEDDDSFSTPIEVVMEKLGISLSGDTDVLYDSRSRTLTMVNTKAEHEKLKEAIKDYQKEKDSEIQQLIAECKRVSGKVNTDAPLFMFISVNKDALEEWEQYGQDCEEMYGCTPREFKKKLKKLTALQKIRGVQTVLAVDKNCEVSRAKKMYKYFKLRGPIIIYDMNKKVTGESEACSGGGDVHICTQYGSNILHVSLFDLEIEDSEVKEVKEYLKQIKEEAETE